MSAASLGALARVASAALAAALVLAALPALSPPVLAREGGGREDGVTVVVGGATVGSGGGGPAEMEVPSERSGDEGTIEVDGVLAGLLRDCAETLEEEPAEAVEGDEEEASVPAAGDADAQEPSGAVPSDQASEAEEQCHRLIELLRPPAPDDGPDRPEEERETADGTTAEEPYDANSMPEEGAGSEGDRERRIVALIDEAPARGETGASSEEREPAAAPVQYDRAEEDTAPRPSPADAREVPEPSGGFGPAFETGTQPFAGPAELTPALPTEKTRSGDEVAVLPDTGGPSWSLPAGVCLLLAGLLGCLASRREGRAHQHALPRPHGEKE